MTAIPKVRLLLRSVYLKGHMDGHKKISDMSWEEDILFQLRQMVGEMKLRGKGEWYIPDIYPEEQKIYERAWDEALDSVMEKMR